MSYWVCEHCDGYGYVVRVKPGAKWWQFWKRVHLTCKLCGGDGRAYPRGYEPRGYEHACREADESASCREADERLTEMILTELKAKLNAGE